MTPIADQPSAQPIRFGAVTIFSERIGLLSPLWERSGIANDSPMPDYRHSLAVGKIEKAHTPRYECAEGECRQAFVIMHLYPIYGHLLVRGKLSVRLIPPA